MDIRSYLTECMVENLSVQLIVDAKNPFFIQGFLHSIFEERIIIRTKKSNREVLIADILGFPQQDL